MRSDIFDDRDKPTPDWTRPSEPPIHHAARKGDLAFLVELIGEGADINVRADLEHDNGPHLRGLTPLMVAARSIDGASVDTLRWLVSNGADIRAESEGGNSAAWYAAGHGARWEFHKKAITPDHTERLRYLLDLGLDPHERNFIGRSLMSEACEAGDPSRVMLLMERGVSPVLDQSTSPLRSSRNRVSTAHGQDIPADLCDAIYGIDVPRGQVDYYQIPLFCAARSGCAKCVRMVLDAGADPNTRDCSGYTALMVAGSSCVIRTLLKAGADRDAVHMYGNDAFAEVLEASCASGACGLERFELARALVDAGVDIEYVDRFGKSRLASAAFGHHADAVDFLLKLGARADARDREGGTPLHSICWQGEHNEELDRACEYIIRALVVAGVPIDAVDHRGRTALHDAASGDWGNPTAVRTLLELGALPDLGDHEGNSPLMLAAQSGDAECIRLLCVAGANAKKVNADGRAPLDAAMAYLQTWESISAYGLDDAYIQARVQTSQAIDQTLGAGASPESDGASELRQEHEEYNKSVLIKAQESVELLLAASKPQAESNPGEIMTPSE